MTPAEHALWQALRRHQLHGLGFRRQHPLGPFIVDFYCPRLKLVIEVDGSVHDDQADYDAARTEQLAAYGNHVIRFRNEAVLGDLASVLDQIAAAAEALENG
jgi:very-short-patch-repair endonuclease